MRIHIQDIQQTRLRDLVFTVATLDMPYYSFIAIEGRLPRPKPKPHHEQLRLRVRLIRPNGTEIEPFASINFVNGQNLPARILLEGLSPEDAPSGTEIASLRYEIAPIP